MIKFTAPITPVAWTRPQFDSRTKKVYNTRHYEQFKDELGYYALTAMRGLNPFQHATKLTAKIFTRYKPESLNAGDWDNHAKAISDALNSICYNDDRQIVEGHIYLFKGTPHVEIELEELLWNSK